MAGVIRVGFDFDQRRWVEVPIPGDGGSHLLVGGSSGAGKSEFLHVVIAQLAELEHTAIVISDPAWMDYEPVWGDRASCIALGREGAGWALEQVEKELHARLRYGRRAGVKRLTPTADTPRLVFVVDELAMVTLVGGKVAANRLVDIAQVGRKVGIGLVLATQSPKATVIPMLVREQVPVRVAFRCEEPEQTDAILGTQRVKAHLIPFTNPGEAWVKLPAGGYAHVKVPWRDGAELRAVSARTAHLTPLLDEGRGWSRLYDPTEVTA